MKLWILVDIGCIECGEQSDIVGTFTSEAAANRVCAQLLSNDEARFHGGQHDYEVFELSEPNKINPEYHQYLTVIDGEAAQSKPLIEGTSK